MIERCFPAPQITNVKFNKDVDLCSKIFSQKMENIMKILEVTDEYSPKIEEEIRLNINILNDICNKIDSLNDELVISLSKDGDDDAEAILEEMERLIDSVKDY